MYLDHFRYVLPVLAVQAMVGEPSEALELRDILSRTLSSQYSETPPPGFPGDNTWQRQDRFTNTSATATATINRIDFIVFDPSTIGFNDIFGPVTGPSNVLDVVAEAARRHPEYDSWGASWSPNFDRATASWEVSSANYRAASSPGIAGGLISRPIVLPPGASFDLWTRLSADTVTLPANDVESEVVIGFAYRGFVTTPEPQPGDFDGNGRVDAGDLAAWRTSFGHNEGADADNDGDTDGNDFLIWQRSLGASAMPVSTAVPEPATATLLLIVLGRLRPRRRGR